MNITPEKPQQFHFWRIAIFCWGVVLFCGAAAWLVTTFFYE